MKNDDPALRLKLDSEPAPDVGATRVITEAEQRELNQTWEKTVDKNLDTAAEVSGGTAGEHLHVETVDTPEFRSRLNNVNRRYQFLDQITEGGFGVIRKAKDRTLDREVIIKSLRKDFLHDPASIRKFIAEAKLNAQLDHPSIVPLYSLDGDDGDGLHLAMKFIDGITLKDFIVRLKVKYNLNRISQAEERSSLQHRLEYFIKVCQAIDYSHSRDIVHCDLKPDNIMIGAYGEVYVMDWGTATHPGKHRKGAIEGTPAYLAPETLIDGTVDPLADVFSLGMILFELVTLKRAVEGQSVGEIIGKIRSGNLEPLTHYMPYLRIAPGLKAIIAKAVAGCPKNRYQSVEDLAEDVRRFMFHEEVLAAPDGIFQRIARRMYNHRVQTFALISLVIVALASVTVWSFYRESVGTQNASEKIFRHIKFQINTDQQGAAIDRYFLNVQNILQTFASNLVLILENPPRHGYQGKIYSLRDFRGAVDAPKDYVYSSAYRCRISLDYPVYFTIAGAPRGDVIADATLRDLYQLRDIMRNLLLQSEPTLNVGGGLKRGDSNTLLIQNGAPVRRIFTILNDRTMISYPGSGDLDETRNPHDWLWYRQALATRKTTWGAFYLDTSGALLLPCATPLLTSSGQVLGVAGIDMSFEYIVGKLMALAQSEGDYTEKYLVNEVGRIVISSRQTRRGYVTGATPKMRSLPSFPYQSTLDRMIREGKEHQAVITVRNRRLLLSYAPVSSLGWYFVQVADLDRVMDLRQQSADDPAEFQARKQFNRYRENSRPVKELIERLRRPANPPGSSQPGSAATATPDSAPQP